MTIIPLVLWNLTSKIFPIVIELQNNLRTQHTLTHNQKKNHDPPPKIMSQIRRHFPEIPKRKTTTHPQKLCRKFGDIFQKFYSERMRRQQAYKGERDTSRRNHTYSSRVSLSRDLTETQYTTTLMLIPGKVLKLSPLHHTVADISSIYLYCREACHNETTTISLLRS